MEELSTAGVNNLFNMQCQFDIFSCDLSNNISNIKLNYDTATKNISKRPGIVLFQYSPQSCMKTF